MNSFQFPGFSKGAFTLCQDETSTTPEKVQARAKRPNLPWTWPIDQQNCEISVLRLLRFQYAGGVKHTPIRSFGISYAIAIHGNVKLTSNFFSLTFGEVVELQAQSGGLSGDVPTHSGAKKKCGGKDHEKSWVTFEDSPLYQRFLDANDFQNGTKFSPSSSWPTNSKWKHLLGPEYARLVARLFVLIYAKLKKLLKNRSCLKRFTKLAHH